jgi:cytochrome P450
MYHNDGRPDRWNSLSPTIKAIPGVYGNVLSFLGGTHACIGYRFALVEFV